MADADVQITAGSGTKVDTRTVGAGSDEHRQVVVIGDPTTAANVQSVTANGEAVIGGNVAHDAVDSGNPVKIGGKASTSTPAAVAAGDRVDAWFTLVGSQNVSVVTPGGVDMSEAAPGSINGLSFTNSLRSISALAGYNGTSWYGLRSGESMTDANSARSALSIALMGYNGTTWDRVRVANTGRLQVDVVTAPSSATAGDVAHDAVDSGNPVKIGGVYKAAPASVASGDRTDILTDPTGRILVAGEITVTGGGASAIAVVNDGSDPLLVQGSHAHDDPDGGYPVKIGGVASITSPTSVADGDRVNAWYTTRGAAVAAITDRNGSNVEAWQAASDTHTPSVYGLVTSNRNYVFDGSSNWTRVRSANGDAQAATGIAAAGLMGFNGATWDRLRTSGTSGRLQVDILTGGAAGSDGQLQGLVSATTNPPGAAAYVNNGTNWDRARSIGGLPAADANTGIPAVAQVPHKIGYAIASATAQYTTTQTSTTLGPTVSASQRMVVTSIQIQAGGTTAGAVQVYFGTGAYSRGTTPAVFDGEFAPSSTSKPGYAQSPSVPYMGAADAELKVTTSAAINPLTVTVWYYLVAV